MSDSIVLDRTADATLDSGGGMPSSWIMEGTPVTRSRTFARSRDLTSWVMVWECSPGRFVWHYNKDETLVIVSGEVFITRQDGTEYRLGPGDWGFFPAGTSCAWRVTSHLRKVAVLRETMPRPMGRALRLWKGLLRKAGLSGRAPLGLTLAYSLFESLV